MTQAIRQSEVEELQRLTPELDAVAVRLARGKPALDLALGEIFLRLSEGEFLLELGCSKMTDIANEALGLPPSIFFVLMELAAALRHGERRQPQRRAVGSEATEGGGERSDRRTVDAVHQSVTDG